MSTALEICAAAYREANLEQDLTSFTSTDFPFSLALQLINKVISKMNLRGKYWFRQTTTVLPFTAGTYTYNLTNLGIEPNAITKMYASLADGTSWQFYRLNYNDYNLWFPASKLQLNRPYSYTIYNDTLSLNAIPDIDYSITVYHLSLIPSIQSEDDPMPCPLEFEQVFQDGVFAWLQKRMEYPSAEQSIIDWNLDVGLLLAKVKNNSGIANQLPAAF